MCNRTIVAMQTKKSPKTIFRLLYIQAMAEMDDWMEKIDRALESVRNDVRWVRNERRVGTWVVWCVGLRGIVADHVRSEPLFRTTLSSTPMDVWIDRLYKATRAWLEGGSMWMRIWSTVRKRRTSGPRFVKSDGWGCASGCRGSSVCQQKEGPEERDEE